MKNAASCEIWCELQNTQIADFSNAHCGSLPILGEPRLSEGRVKLAEDSRVQRVRVGLSDATSVGSRRARLRVPGICRKAEGQDPAQKFSKVENCATSDQTRQPAELKHISKRRKETVNSSGERFPRIPAASAFGKWA
ncbi:hypothetical protein TNCV_5029201 [Trichonephila clavipes]|nr:hypothetical protein TNCV_5029201 [Trichonephila clavipes]